jgi:hypothetical protein
MMVQQRLTGRSGLFFIIGNGERAIPSGKIVYIGASSLRDFGFEIAQANSFLNEAHVERALGVISLNERLVFVVQARELRYNEVLRARRNCGDSSPADINLADDGSCPPVGRQRRSVFVHTVDIEAMCLVELRPASEQCINLFRASGNSSGCFFFSSASQAFAFSGYKSISGDVLIAGARSATPKGYFGCQ